MGPIPSRRHRILKLIKDKVQRKLVSPYFDLHITLSGPYFKIDKTFIYKLRSFGEEILRLC